MKTRAFCKRLMALLLAVLLLVSVTPLTAIAEELPDGTITEGDQTGGDNLGDNTGGELEEPEVPEEPEEPEPIIGVDVSTLEELEQELAAGTAAVALTADIVIDRPVYITADVVIYSEETNAFVRGESYAGDLFVVGQNPDGTLTEGDVRLTLGRDTDTQSGLLTINGNKQNTTVNVVGSGLFVCATGRVVMYNSVTIQDHKKVGNERTAHENVTVSYPERVGGAAAIIADGGEWEMWGGSFVGNEVNTVVDDANTCIQGGAIYNYGTMDVYGGLFEDNLAYFGGALFNYRRLNMYHATVQNNQAIAIGGAIYIPNSTAAYTNIATETDKINPYVLFANNTSGENGGAIYARHVIDIGNAVFENNQNASGYGGAIYSGGIQMTMEGTVFRNNTSASNGGALHVTTANGDEETVELTADKVTFVGNTATKNGGAMYVSTDIRVRLTDATFTDNTATNGGAMYVNTGLVDMNGGSFSGNEATTKGGVLYTQENSTVVFNKITATANRAADAGFAYSTDTDMTIYDSTFAEHTVTGSSAVLALYAGAATKIYGCTFKNNESAKNGGVITGYTSEAQVLVHNSSFLNNTCNGFGGAMHISGKTQLTLYCVTAIGNSGTHGGFMYHTAAGTNVTIGGLTLSGNTASTGGNNIWGNTVNAKLYLDQSKCVEKDYVGVRDYAYWTALVANKLTVTYPIVDVPSYLDYAGNEIMPQVPAVPVDATTVAELEEALASSNPLVRIMADIVIDRTLYVTKDTTIFAAESHTLTRAADFAGDLFVVGQKKNGGLVSDVTLTLGRDDSDKSDQLILDGNKANVTVPVVGSALFVCEDAQVILYKEVTLQNHKKVGNERTSHENVTVSYPVKVGGAAILIANKGAVDVYGSRIINNEVNTTADENETCIQGGAIYNYGTLNVYGADISGNTAYFGGALFNYRRLNLYKANVSNNTSADLGGALYVPNSTAAFTKIGLENDVVESYVVFSGNQSGDHGGAVYARNAIDIANTLFENNKNTSGYGGALYAGTVRMTMQDVIFRGNVAANVGGAVYMSGSNEREDVLELSGRNVTFEQNTATNGGAMYLSTGTRAYLKNATFTDNSTTSAGGALYVKGTSLEMDGVTTTGNVAGSKAGVLYSTETSTVMLNKMVATGNRAADGGVFYITDTVTEIYASCFAENVVTGSSAVMALYAGADTKVYGSVFENNESAKNAGAITAYSSEAPVLVQDCQFRNNTCHGYGGAIHVSGQTQMTLYDITVTSNSATHGGFMYHTSAGTNVTLVGLTVQGNTGSTGGPIIWGNTFNAKLYIDKSKVVDKDHTGAYDDAYWAAAIYNKLTVIDISQEIPKYLDYGNEAYPNMADAVDVESAAELEAAINAGHKHIRVVADFVLDRTFYITKDVTIFSTFPRTLTRAADFAGDIFVVGEFADGSRAFIKNGKVTLTLGNPDSQTEDLLTIDGNRENMTVPVSGSVVFVAFSGVANFHNNLTVVDCYKSFNQRLYEERYVLSTRDRPGGAVAAVVSGTLNIRGGRYSNNACREVGVNEDGTSNYETAYGGAIYNLSTVRISGGTFTENEGAYGAVLLNYRIAEITGGTFENNHATTRGGAIYAVDTASAHTYIGTKQGESTVLFKNNSATSHGGAIYSSQLAAMIIYGNTVFDGNTTASSGGAICVYGQLTARDTIFRNNVAPNRGGAVYLSNNADYRVTRYVKFENCSFENNQGYLGGALSTYASSADYANGGIINVDNCIFTGNRAVKQTGGTSSAAGGAIYSERRSIVTVNDSVFADNTAELEGGALYLSGETDAEVHGSSFTGSYAGKHGGAVTVRSSYLDMTDVTFSDNSCVQNGGTIYVSYNSSREMNAKVNLTDCSFTNSQSLEGYGGTIYATKRTLEKEHPVLTMERVTINGSTAAKSGGAMQFNTGLEAYLKDVNITNADALDGKGGAMYLAGAIVEYDGGQITNCTSTGNGGALDIEGDADVTLNDITASGNRSGTSGGFMYHKTATVKLYNSTIRNNTTEAGSGGAVYAQGPITVYNVLFEGNGAPAGNGGAFVAYTSGGQAEVYNTTFRDNASSGNGGALYVSGESLLGLYGITATGNQAGKGGFMYETTTDTVATLNGVTLSGNTATEAPVIWGNSAGAVLKINKQNYTDTDHTGAYDDAYWAAAIINKLTVEEVTGAIPTGEDYLPRPEEVINPPQPRTPVSVDEVLNLALDSDQGDLNSTYAKFPRLDNSSNFMSSNVTTFENINGGDVTVDTIVYPAHSTSSNMNFSQGMLIYQAMLYKQAHPEEDVNIHITSYRFSVQTGLCLNRNSRYFGYMRQLPANVNYDKYGFVRIAYLLVTAAKMGINVTIVGQQDAYPIDTYDMHLEDYFDYYLPDPCDPIYAQGKFVSDYMNWQHCRWTLQNKGGTDMMHLKLCAVSDYLDMNGVEHHNALWTSSSNLDGITSNGANANWKQQTATIVTNHEALYRTAVNYVDLMASLSGQEDIYEFQHIMSKRSVEQIDLQLAGRGNEIPPEEQLAYIGGETDPVFELYFTPMGGGSIEWDERYNAYCKYLREMYNSEDYILFTWNAAEYNGNYALGQQMEDIIVAAFHKNKNANNKVYMNTESFDGSAFDDLVVGQDIGLKSFNKKELGGIHNKDVQISYQKDGQRYYVNLLNSMNVHSGSMYYQANHMLVIKETDCDEDSVFFTIADRTTRGVVEHEYGQRQVFFPEDESVHGHYYQECVNCGKEKQLNTAHRPGDWTTVRNATAEKSGIQERACIICGVSVESREIRTEEEATFDFSQVIGRTFTLTTATQIPVTTAKTPHTFEALVHLPKMAVGRGGVILGNYTGGTEDQINLEIHNTGRVRLFYVKDGVKYDQIFNTDVRSDSVIHIAVTVDGTTATLYVGGAPVEVATLAVPLPENMTTYTVGGDSRQGNAQYFRGTIYGVHLFADVRTASEMRSDAVQIADTADELLYSQYYRTESAQEMVEGTVRAYAQTFTDQRIHRVDRTLTAAPQTVEATIRVPKDVDTAGVIVGNYATDDQPYLNLEMVSGGRVQLTASTGTVTFATDLRGETATHIAVTAKDTTANLYVNGVLAETKTMAAPLPQTLTGYAVGGDNRTDNTAYFKGAIYGVHLFGDLRSVDEIKADAVMVTADAPDLLYSGYFVAGDDEATRIVSGRTFTEDSAVAVEQPLTTTPKTIEAWFNLPKSILSRGGIIFGNYDKTSQNPINLEVYYNGQVRLFYINDGVKVDQVFKTDVRSADRTHIVVTIDGVLATLYVDGVAKEAAWLAAEMPQDSLTDYKIGGDNRANYKEPFRGALYGVSVYGDLRTVDEIAQGALGQQGVDDCLVSQDFSWTDETVDGKLFAADALEGLFPELEGAVNIEQPLKATPYTFEAVIRLPKSVNGRIGTIVGNYSRTSENPINLEIYQSGQVRLFYINNGVKVDHSFATNVCSDTMTHIAVTVDGTTATLYVSGVAVETASLAVPLPESTDDYVVGSDNRATYQTPFKGGIYAVNLFRDVRTAEEIRQDAVMVTDDADGLLYGRYFADVAKEEELKPGKTFTAGTALSLGTLDSIPMTIEAKLYVPTTMDKRAGTIVGSYTDAEGQQLNLEVYYNGTVRLVFKDGTTTYKYPFEVDVRGKKPVHIAVTLDGNKATLYVNGEKADAIRVSHVPTAVAEPYFVGGDGREGNAQYFKGMLYSAALFRDLRTAEEIRQDAVSVAPNAEDLIAWQSFEDDAATGNIHVPGEWTVDLPATNTDKGIQHQTCVECGQVVAFREVGRVVADGRAVHYEGTPTTYESGQPAYKLDDFAGAPKTFEATILLPKTVTSRAGVILGSYDGSAKNQINIEVYTSGRLRLYFKTSGYTYNYIFKTDIRSNEPTHVALTVDGNVANLYHNGELKETGTMSKKMPEVMDGFCVGGDNRPFNDQYFQGGIYGVHMFDDVRTAEEIAQDRVLVTTDTEGLLYSEYFIQ